MESSGRTDFGEQSPIDDGSMPLSTEEPQRSKGLSESGTSCNVDNDEDHSCYFPPGIWEQILLRLPFKSIFRMRCVCKSWLSLTLTPSFIRSHCLLAQERLSSSVLNPPWTLLYRYTCGQQFRQISSHLCSFDHRSPQFSVLLSSARNQLEIIAENAGLLLLHRSQMHGGDYFVCNPITKQLVTLPPMPRRGMSFHPDGEEQPVIHRTFFSRSKSQNNPGLIVMSRNGLFTHYKVVVPINPEEATVPSDDFRFPEFYRFFIFCSQHGKWTDFKLIYRSPARLDSLCLSMPVTLNGTIYWPDYGRGFLLIYQVVENNEEACVKIIKLPRIYDGGDQSRMCGVSSGNLRYFRISKINGRVMLEVWELEDSNPGQWSMKHGSDWSGIWSEDECLCKKLQDTRSSQKSCFEPVAFHPFDSDVIYLHNRE